MVIRDDSILMLSTKMQKNVCFCLVVIDLCQHHQNPNVDEVMVRHMFSETCATNWLSRNFQT